MTRVEVLAPAGSIKSMQASFKAGADAVYMGGTKFGARAYAENPEEDNLIAAIDYAHKRGKNLYLTVNTVIKEQEVSELIEFLKPLYERGLDAVIVQDLGLVKLVEEHLPGLPIHLSTQMSITSASALTNISKQCTRVVPARELTIKEIEKLKECGLELEVFVHGALCYSYSGQCLFSSMAGDRSGNRGRCAQPCRKLYSFNGKESYLLSPKDICTLSKLPEFIEADVDSFKIEGRMKAPHYAAGVAFIYKEAVKLYESLGKEGYYKYIKENPKVWEEKITLLKDLFNRGGFSEGYAFTKPGTCMMATNRPNHEGVLVGMARIKKGYAELINDIKLNKGDVLELRGIKGVELYSYTLPEDKQAGSKVSFKATTEFYKSRIEGQELEVYRYRNDKLINDLTKEYVEAKDMIKLKGEFYAKAGEPLKLTVSTYTPNARTGKVYSATAYGDVVEPASKAPADEKSVSEKLLRSGDSEYEFAELKVELDGEVFIAKSALGRIRREALELLDEVIIKDFFRDEVSINLNEESLEDEARELKKHIQIFSRNQLDYALSLGGEIIVDMQSPMFNEIQADASLLDTLSKCGLYIRSLRVYDDINKPLYDSLYKLIKTGMVKGVYLRNLSVVNAIKEIAPADFKIYADSNLYVANHHAAEKLKELGFTGFSYSTELSFKEMLKLKESLTTNMDSVLTIYGREELMVSRQCIKNTTGRCNKTPEWLSIRSEEGRRYPVFSACAECKNIIYDDKALNITSFDEEVKKLNPNVVRILLTNEESMLTGEATSTRHFLSPVM